MTRTPRNGYTLVELMFAVIILAVVIGIPGTILRTSRQAYDASTSTTGLDQDARRALDRIAASLADSGLSGIVDPAPVALGAPLTGVTFRRLIGLDDGAPVWGVEERIELVLAPGEALDGVDNDGDGLVDDGRVVWLPDTAVPSRIVQLASSVRATLPGEVPGNGGDDNGNGLVDERGFVIRFGVDRIEVILALERRDAGGTVYEQVATRFVALRN